MAGVDDILDRLRGERDALVERYAQQITIAEGRAAGDDRTVVFADVLLPDMTAALAPSPFEVEDDAIPDRARWRMRTSSADRTLRLGRHAARSSALAAYHGAEASKDRAAGSGRRAARQRDPADGDRA